MECLNKNKVLAYYFGDGTEGELAEIREHINKCNACQQYLGELKQTMCKLDKLEEEEPAPYILKRLMIETADSSQAAPVKPQRSPAASIVQIAAGQLFLFAVIYIVNSSAWVTKIWENLKNYLPLQVFGSMGITLTIIFGVGALITLAAAPILLHDSKRRKSFSLK